jgi:hypothetical protein
MSVFAKIFIVINLGLTLTLTGVMATMLAQKADHKRSYAQSVQELVTQRQSLKDARAQSDESTQRAKGELDRHDSEIKLLKDRIEANAQSKRQAEGRRVDLQKNIDIFTTDIKKLEKRKEDLSAELAKLDQRRRDATTRRDQAVAARDVALGSLDERKREIATLERSIASLVTFTKEFDDRRIEIESLLKQARSKGISVEKLAEVVKKIGRQVTGTIDAVVDERFGVFTIDIGSDAEVEEGHELIVSRGDNYIGKVVVEEVTPRKSKVIVIRDSMVQGRTIQAGDTVKRY